MSRKSNALLARIRNTSNNKIVAQIFRDRNKPHYSFFQRFQDVVNQFPLNKMLLPIHDAPHFGTMEGRNDHSIILKLPKWHAIELKQPDSDSFTLLLQGGLDLYDSMYEQKFSAFVKQKPKICSAHLSLLKSKSFINQREEQHLCTFALHGNQGETLLVEPNILRYHQLTGDTQHTHLRVDIKNAEGQYPFIFIFYFICHIFTKFYNLKLE